jgi:hypothetical protein
VFDFEDLSERVWNTLNDSYYSRLDSIKQYEASFHVSDLFWYSINDIRNQATATSSYKTKLSALGTLCKIAKTVLLANDTLGHQVRKQFGNDGYLVSTMLGIAKSMTPKERLRASVNNADGRGTLVSKLEWVRSKAEDCCIKGLDVSNVLALLGGDLA